MDDKARKQYSLYNIKYFKGDKQAHSSYFSKTQKRNKNSNQKRRVGESDQVLSGKLHFCQISLQT